MGDEPDGGRAAAAPVLGDPSHVPGDREPKGFVLTTILGIVGAFVATYLGQALHWYAPGEGAGLIGAVVGAVIILVIWGFIARRRA